MDFSPWDRTKIFQLHEAACLIAGVMPSSKRVPAREELPSHALQYYKLLATAYVLWVMHDDQHDDPNYPKAEMLRGEPQIGSDEPTLAVSIDKLPGEFVSRDELRRWIAATGIKSAYNFGARSAAVTNKPLPPGDAPVKKRRDLLSPVIEAAQRECGEPYDAPAVFAVLKNFAESQKKPLIGGVTEDGIQWEDEKGEPQFLSLKNLRERLNRQKRRGSPVPNSIS